MKKSDSKLEQAIVFFCGAGLFAAYVFCLGAMYVAGVWLENTVWNWVSR